jgi:cell division septation protein DedD
MRDLQHWKDKVELSLDGRQVFFLFFGGAVLACLLFALGVMTGRRLEARAIALDTPSTEDPLAALDQLGDLEDEDLSYHRVLTKEGNRSARKDVAKAAPARALVPAPMGKPVPPPAPVGKPATPKPVPHAAIEEQATADAPAAPPVLKAEAKERAPLPRLEPKPAAKPEPKVADVGQAHFTLQLSAFSAKKDADELVHRVQAAGYKPFVVTSDIPGKGVLFRVRVGDYASKDAAIAEKSAVESKLKVAAYLAKL